MKKIVFRANVEKDREKKPQNGPSQLAACYQNPLSLSTTIGLLSISTSILTSLIKNNYPLRLFDNVVLSEA